MARPAPLGLVVFLLLSAGAASGQDATPVEVLVAQLGDSNPNARSRAAVSLGKIGPSAASAIPALLVALVEEHDAVRFGAAWASAAPPLRSRNEGVR
jgi:HEAT repeat protein